jgi:2'-5' RNA ligase
VPQPDFTGSCHIALYPPREAAEALAIEDGLDAEQIHLTIAYLGDAKDVDPEALAAVAQAIADRDPFTAKISGHARFTGAEQDCIVAVADSPEIERLRADTLKALDEQGLSQGSEHGYIAHITMRYIGADEDDPVGRLAPFPVTFSKVSAVHGDTRTDYRFNSGLEDLAVEAYFAGWSLSGGPLTQRVTTGMRAAVATALEHATDPQVLELTLQIGKLEGAWALVFDRREKLIAHHVGKIQVLWRKLAADLDPSRMVRSFRQNAGMTRETADPQKDTLRAEAIALAAGMLNGIRSGVVYEEFVTAIEAALAAGAAEGKTAALAVAAEVAGHDGFDWAAAFAHVYEPLTHLENLPGMADPWVQRLIDGNAADIGRKLASLASDGATYEEMAAAVKDLMTGDVRAVRSLIDYAMSGSMAQGSLNLYASEGVQQVAWLTAGDERVCLTPCESNEAQGPYPPEQFPSCPAHPRCRCCPAPVDPLPLSAYAQFLP